MKVWSVVCITTGVLHESLQVVCIAIGVYMKVCQVVCMTTGVYMKVCQVVCITWSPPQVLLPANPNAIPLGQTGTPLLVQLVVSGSLADCDRLFWPWTYIYRSMVLALEVDGRCLKWMSPSVIRGSFKNRTAHIGLTLDKNAYFRSGYVQLLTRERQRQRQRHRDREREIIFFAIGRNSSNSK